MRKARIICTIGPSSESSNIIGKMIDAGMDAARLNFSHGSHNEHGKRYRLIRKMASDRGKQIGVIQDLQGAKVRIGIIGGDGTVTLRKDREFTLTTEQVEGTPNMVSVDYPKMPGLIKRGDGIFIDDGRIELEATGVKGNTITCRVVRGGALSSRKGIILPGMRIDLPGLMPQDERDLEFGLKLGVDFIAHSFVRKPDHVKRLRRFLRDRGAGHVGIISKIEDGEGVENIDGIIEQSDAIMIARGDMGVCLDRARVPIIQQEIIEKCNRAGKPVIVATQMLESMVSSSIPTRAEVSDIASAVQEGSDALMLSAETAVGEHPVEAVSEMSRIIGVIEQSLEYGDLPVRKHIRPVRGDILDSMAYAARELAFAIDAKAIIALTHSGKTAEALVRFRPGVPIFVFTDDAAVARGLSLACGVQVFTMRSHVDSKRARQRAVEELLARRLAGKGDVIVITRGIVGARRTDPVSFIDVVKV